MIDLVARIGARGLTTRWLVRAPIGIYRAGLAHAQTLREAMPSEMTTPELALRFILYNPSVSTVIPGMRSAKHVRANIEASDAGPLSRSVIARLRPHRWDREPTAWSQ